MQVFTVHNIAVKVFTNHFIYRKSYCVSYISKADFDKRKQFVTGNDAVH